jgi:hypothetical protein
MDDQWRRNSRSRLALTLTEFFNYCFAREPAAPQPQERGDITAALGLRALLRGQKLLQTGQIVRVDQIDA